MTPAKRETLLKILEDLDGPVLVPRPVFPDVTNTPAAREARRTTSTREWNRG
jgi:hypothetical protein